MMKVVVSNSLRLVCLCLAIAGAVAAQTAANPAGPIVAALRSREFDRALELLQPALKAAPGNPQLLAFQGLAYSGKRDSKAALRSYQSALKINPDYLPALEGAAQIQYNAGDVSAITLLQRILRLHPEEQTTHAMLAVLAYKKRDCATAVQHFEQSGSLVDSQPGALQDYGACLMEQKQTDKAIPVFRKIAESHPDDPRAVRSLAAVQLEAGNPKEALATLQPLMTAVEPDSNTLQLAAAAYEAEQDTPNAVKVLRDAIVKSPRDTALYVDFANIALSHQSFQAGIEMVNAGLTLQPEAAELYLARGVLYVQMAEFDKADADFAKAEKLDPRQSLSAAAQGMVAEEKNQNNPDQALATVRSKLNKRPSDPFLWYLQAAILAQKAPATGSAEFQQAMQSGKKAVALQPSLVAAHNVLAKLYLQSGQTALAVEQCKLALKDSPNDQTALYHLVLALRKTNDKHEIPALLNRLAKARQDAAKDEADRNRFKLMVQPNPSSE